MAKFEVSVSVEALRKSYHKNKDSIFESDKPVQNPVIKQKSIIEKRFLIRNVTKAQIKCV